MQLLAQSTYFGNLYISSQTDLNAISNQYTTITGNVDISLSDVVDLSPLNSLEIIGGNLWIRNNNNLTSIDGLDNLTTIGGELWIARNAGLVAITGLNNLTKVGGFDLEFNLQLETVTGIQKLQSVDGSFRMYYCSNLNTVTGFSNLTLIEDDLIISRCNLIPSLSFLSNVEDVPGDFTIEDNSVIENLDGLQNLKSVGGFFSVEGISKIKSLNEFSNLSKVGLGIEIDDNPDLINLNGLKNIAGNNNLNLTIRGNKSLTSLQGLSFITGSVRNLVIQSNDKLFNFNGLEGITSVQFRLIVAERGITSVNGLDNIISIGDDVEFYFNEKLLSLKGLDNVNYIGGDIDISNNSKLRDIDIFTNITQVIGDMEISFNSELDDFSAFNNLTSVIGEFYIRDNGLTNLDGLENLKFVTGDLTFLVNRKLENVDGLSGLIQLGKRLRVIANGELTNLNGLRNLESVASNVEITNNDKLVEVNGLINLASVGASFLIYNNSILEDCCILADVFNDPEVITGSISIFGNAPSCNDVSKLTNWCKDLDGDGFAGRDGDCDNSNAQNFPGNIEVCDGIDNNCDGVVDEGFEDLDNDGIGDACDNCNSFVILSSKNTRIRETNILSGGIGVIQDGKKAKIRYNSSVEAEGTFVIAPKVKVRDGSKVNTAMETNANGCTPSFKENPHDGQETINVEEGDTVILNQQIYKKIKIKKNATVIFSGHAEVFIEKLRAKSGVTIIFNQCTDLMVQKIFKLGENNNFNPTNENVGIFAEQKIVIKGKSTARGFFYSQEVTKIRRGTSDNRNQMFGQFVGRNVVSQKYTDLHYQDYTPCVSFTPLQNIIPPSEEDLLQEENIQAKSIENTQKVRPIKGLSLSPNPASVELRIQLEEKYGKNAFITIFNSQGRKILQQNISEWDDSQTTIDVSSYERGWYTVVVSAEGMDLIVEKFIIQR